MSSHTFMLLEGQKVQMEVDPDAINTVAVSLDDGSVIYAVAGEDEEKKLLLLHQIVEEEKLISLRQNNSDSAAA